VSASPLVNVIAARLRNAGYQDLATPFRVATVEFEFTAAMRGRDGRALDLILLFDTTTGEFGDRDAARVRQRVQALGRALDVTGSRYVVTAILAGAVLAGDIEALAETCRVLHVEALALDDDGGPLDETARNQLDDRIRVLLPLELPAPVLTPDDAGGSAMELLERNLPKGVNRALLDAVVAASQHGEAAVTEAMAEVISDALRIEEAE